MLSPSHKPARPARGLGAAVLAATLMLAACVANNSASPHARRPTPDARPERLAVFVDGQFADTDANRYGDTNQAVVYVFTDLRFDLPMEASGAFVFTLRDPNGAIIREWSFDADAAARSRLRTPVGPGFAFTLSLLEGGTDRVDGTEGELTCSFEPSSGSPPVRTRLSSLVTVGPIRPSGSSGWSTPNAR
ncbi:MAG: hypothetical protein ACKVU4_01290 [Phycisphaerales bacterium]